MAGKFSSHVRSNVIGYLALFVALSGTAWAATELEKNEVKSKHIGKGQVKTADLAKNAVASPKVADGSLLERDFAAGQLPRGERGLPGETGEPGPPGISGREVIRALSNVDANDSKQVTAFCPPGKKAIAGGTWINPDNGSVPVAITKDSIPVNLITGEVSEAWVGRATEMSPTDTAWSVDVRVICANVSG